MSAMAANHVANLLDREWLGAGPTALPRGAPNIDGGIVARWTDRPKGKLIIHPKDNADLAYVLVVGDTQPFTVPGWIRGRDGKRQEYWIDSSFVRFRAYFVPQQALAPLETLR